MDGYLKFTDNPFADPGAGHRAETLQVSEHNANRSSSSVPSVSTTDENATAPQRIQMAGLDGYNPFDAGKNSHPPSNNPAVLNFGDPPAYSPTNAQKFTTAELERRQKELEARAADLARREEEQRRLEDQSRRSASVLATNKNWPPLPSFCPCAPCFYQNIELEIVSEYQKIVKFGYYLWASYACLLCINVFGAMLYFAGSGAFDGGSLFGVSILVSIICIPASYICWFRPLYKAFRSNSSFNFFVFFFVFFVQVIVMIIQSIGLLNWGSCGWITGLSVVRLVPWVGAITLIIACLFTATTVAASLYLVRVHRIYRSTGSSFHKAREEFVRGVASDNLSRTIATEAGLFAAQQAFAGDAGTNTRPDAFNENPRY